MKYEKFEEWMIGKTVRDDCGDEGVVTREHDLSKYENGMSGVVVGESLDALIVKFDNGEEECVTIHELIEE